MLDMLICAGHTIIISFFVVAMIYVIIAIIADILAKNKEERKR